jgi:hypothetical protein
MILDFETNSVNVDDVVEVAAAFSIERVKKIIKGVLIGVQ